MQDLSALTPPLVIALVVLFAIAAFLRHEMGRKRPDQDGRPADDGAERSAPDRRADSSNAAGRPSADHEES